MADTLNNISIPHTRWVNINTESGIPLTTQIKVQNVGGVRILLYTGATAPNGEVAFNSLEPSNFFFINELPTTGEWAKAVDSDGLLNVGVKV